MDNCNHDSVGEVITLNPKADLFTSTREPSRGRVSGRDFLG